MTNPASKPRIKEGDSFPAVTVGVLKDNQIISVNTAEFFNGKKVVLFAVPGPFTPTCHKEHCPSYIREAKAFQKKGVDLICCTSVSDPFVMDAWNRALGGQGLITMLADGNGDLAAALGMVKDCRGAFMGLRTLRYSMFLDNGVVKHLFIDEKGYGNTSAEQLLQKL